jgi:hypothetical protein
MAQNIHFENPPPPTENEVVPSRRNAIPAKTRATNAAGAARASRNIKERAFRLRSRLALHGDVHLRGGS